MEVAKQIWTEATREAREELKRSFEVYASNDAAPKNRHERREAAALERRAKAKAQKRKVPAR